MTTVRTRTRLVLSGSKASTPAGLNAAGMRTRRNKSGAWATLAASRAFRQELVSGAVVHHSRGLAVLISHGGSSRRTVVVVHALVIFVGLARRVRVAWCPGMWLI